MKNAKHFNSLVDNQDTILTTHLKADAKKRKQQWDKEHDDDIVLKFIIGIITVAIAVTIIVVELIF